MKVQNVLETGQRYMIRTDRWRNYHNDEKVMREAKSIIKEDHKTMSGKSLRIGGTDHQQIKVLNRTAIKIPDRERGKKRMIEISQ